MSDTEQEFERSIENVLWELFDHPMHRKKKLTEIMELIESRDKQIENAARVDEAKTIQQLCSIDGLGQEVWEKLEKHIKELKDNSNMENK